RAGVEAALPDGHGAEGLRGLEEARAELLAAVGVEGVGVQADRDARAGDAARQAGCLLPARGGVARDEEALDARGPRPREHRRAVLVEGREVEVTVAVEEAQ